MKICIAGRYNIAISICEKLLESFDKNQILIIPTRLDKEENGFQRSLLYYAHQKELRIVELEDVYIIPDLIFLSIEFDRIIKTNLFKSDKLFNIHFSLLPSYKGMYTSALPIINGDIESGVTLHQIDCGIDTGDIIDQRKFEISFDETAKSLHNKYLKFGTELLLENLEKIISGDYSKTKQSNVKSTYFSRSAINYSGLFVNLNATGWQIAAQIRAFTFRNYQLPIVFGYSIFRAEITDIRSHNKPGSIIEDLNDYLIVSSVDYNVKLIKDQFDIILQLCKCDDIKGLKEVFGLRQYLNEQNNFGWTPLIVAAYNNSKLVFKYLIQMGADYNLTNYNGTTVLMYAKDAAINFNDFEIVDILIKCGVNIFAKDYNDKNIFDYIPIKDSNLSNHIKSLASR